MNSISQIVVQLSTYKRVLEAEIEEISKDIQNCRILTKKYGEHWEVAFKQLEKQRSEKESLLNDIKLQTELLMLHIDTAQQLVKKLSEFLPMKMVETQKSLYHSDHHKGDNEENVVAIVSKILANADEIDSDQEEII